MVRYNKENLINLPDYRLLMVLIQSFSGIRGVYGKDLNEDVARRYAYAYFLFLRNKNPKIVVGTDTRVSSKNLKKAVLEVFEDIIDIGIATMPMTELAVREYKADGGVMITASHNEPEWNGFKFLDKDGAVLREKKINEVINNFNKIRSLDAKDFLDNYLHKNKKCKVHKIIKKHADIKRRYYDFVLKIIGKENIKLIKNSNFKIVLDSNGGSGIVMIDILKKLGINIIGINTEPGKFKRRIEPDNESLKYLKDIINNAEFAAGFDCDADRVEILLPDGSIVSGQYVLALVIDEVLSSIKTPEKETIVVNDATSNLIKDIAAKYKTRVIETDVGEINVVDAMLQYNSLIGGEGSSAGVIIPPSRCRDGTLTLLFILRLMAKRKSSLKELIKYYPKYYTLKSKVNFNPKEHDKIKNRLKEYYLKKGYKVQETSITGSLKVIIGDSFVWFRASKTEDSVFRVMSDSKSKEKAEYLLEEGKRFINH